MIAPCVHINPQPPTYDGVKIGAGASAHGKSAYAKLALPEGKGVDNGALKKLKQKKQNTSYAELDFEAMGELEDP